MGASISGGDKLLKKVAEIVSSSGDGEFVKVGFLSGSTETDSGLPSAFVAAANEYGGTIPSRVVEAHVTTIYRKVDKQGDLLNGGRFVRASRSNFATTHVVPTHVIPSYQVPARPFFRRMIKLGEGHWGEDLGKALKRYKYNATQALSYLGTQLSEELKESIQARVYAPLANSTVKAKGHDQTLIDTGDMLNAVDFNISE